MAGCKVADGSGTMLVNKILFALFFLYCFYSLLDCGVHLEKKISFSGEIFLYQMCVLYSNFMIIIRKIN